MVYSEFIGGNTRSQVLFDSTFQRGIDCYCKLLVLPELRQVKTIYNWQFVCFSPDGTKSVWSHKDIKSKMPVNIFVMDVRTSTSTSEYS